MPFRIQRLPSGLNDLMSIFGGQTPVELEDRVRASVELTQYYGSSQLDVQSVNDPALAEGAALTFRPAPNNWIVLYSVSATIIKTATMTALRAAVALRLRADVAKEVGLASEELGPFGATETGAVSVIWTAPFPRIIPPNTSFVARPQIIGTDATANVTLGVHFGLLG